MLEKIKHSLRIGHNGIDEDIKEHIDACKLDLQRVGVKKIEDTDALIIQAMKLYVKWHLNFEDEADRYQNAYEMLRNSLAMCGDYNV